MMENKKAVPMLVMYRVKPGNEQAFEPLLRKHWPALRTVDLATPKPAKIYRGHSKRGHGPEAIYVELFEWKDASSAEVAHQTPEVMAVWEPMGPMLAGMDLIALDELPS
jgi:hypothetical protein